MNRGSEQAPAWRQAQPELSVSTRLLLLLSRIRLDDEQSQRALALCELIDDWEGFAERAAEFFIAPLCLHHLARLGEGPPMRQARAALRERAMPMALQTLRLAALQRRFIELYLLPLKMPFAMIKGRALAARYYPDASLRFARDLDVLVPAERIPELIIASQQDGYRVYPERRLISLDEAQLLCRHSRVVTLVDAENILIEVHAQLDKAGFLLDHRAALERAERSCVDGVETGMLTTLDHFVYICLHHTKHFWSRLNWLADLDALIQAPDFDEAQALLLARERGVEKTVAACIALHKVCADSEPWQVAQRKPEVLDLLRACLVILERGTLEEFEMRPDRLSKDFNFDWQLPKGFRRRERWRSLLIRLRPSVMDYRAMPLPRAWHWLYFATRPFRLLLRGRSP